MSFKTQPNIYIADRGGDIIAEITPALSVIPWRLNKWSKITLRMTRTDPKLQPEYFTPGNRIILEFDNGLPNWGGFIDYPEGWDKDRYEISAYSPEWMLLWRITDRGRYFDQASTGLIFTSLIEEANRISDMGIQIKKAYNGQTAHTVEFHFKNLYKIFKDTLAKYSGEEFWIDTIRRDNRITFEAYWEKDRGEFKGHDILFTEGRNISDLKLRKQGPIINDWSLAGTGDTWGDDRLYSFSASLKSQALYGVRQGSAVYPDIINPETLDLHADALLAGSENAANRWSLKVLNIPPAEYASYHVGDTVRMIAPSYGWRGFDGMVRIIEILYDPSSGQCIAIIEDDHDPNRDGVF